MEVTVDAVQLLGGAGYTRDFPRTHDARRQDHPDLRGHQPDPASSHEPCAAEVTFLRRLIVVLSAVLLIAACGSDPEPPRPPDQAAGQVYVNLGDSYASGTGAFPLQEGSPFLCFRSQHNFARIVAERTGRALTDVSCAGATTDNMTTAQYDGVPPQLDALSDRTELVTMMLGGNDNGTFGRSISVWRCRPARPKGLAVHRRSWRRVARPDREAYYPALVDALRSIREHAPRARVLIVGYPWIMPPEKGCFPDIPDRGGDVPLLREIQTSLNAVVERAAKRTGVTFCRHVAGFGRTRCL